MLFDDVLRNPLLRKAIEAGEERMGKVVGKLLSSEGLSGGVQTLFHTAAQARETLEKGVSQALHAANLPSRDDVAALKRRLEELEAMLDGLAHKVEAGAARAGGAPPPRVEPQRGEAAEGGDGNGGEGDDGEGSGGGEG